MKNQVFKVSQAKRHHNLYLTIAYSSIVLAVCISVFTCFISAFQYITFDIGPDPDQIRDAFVVMKMWEGEFPILGPASSVGNYSLPPLYYYLVFPFSLFGADPIFQVLPNAIFAVLSVPLLSYLTYQLLDNIEQDRRLLLSGLAGLWYSLLFGVIFISTFQWNPSSTPFFLTIFLLLLRFQFQNTCSLNVQILSWALCGVILSILVSLHSSNLFVIPAVFILLSLVFVWRQFRYRRFKQMGLPLVSIASSVIVLFPYWKGEFSRNFANSRAIIRLILESRSTTGVGNIFTRFSKIFWTYFDLGHQLYFPEPLALFFSISFIALSLGSILSLWKFRGDRVLWGILWLLWGVYFYAASSFDRSSLIFYYKVLILTMPILSIVVGLAYLNNTAIEKVFAAILVGSIFVSIGLNLYHDVKYLKAQYGSQRLMTTRDTIEILKKIPDNATICDPRIARNRQDINQYRYLSQYVLKKEIMVTSDCDRGRYVIHPKYIMGIHGHYQVNGNLTSFNSVPCQHYRWCSTSFWPQFTRLENVKITREVDLVRETQTALIYQIK